MLLFQDTYCLIDESRSDRSAFFSPGFVYLVGFGILYKDLPKLVEVVFLHGSEGLSKVAANTFSQATYKQANNLLIDFL